MSIALRNSFLSFLVMVLSVFGNAVYAQSGTATVTALSPARNAVGVPINLSPSGLKVTLDQNWATGTTAQNSSIFVHSQQSGGKRAGTYTVSGTSNTFIPSSPFKPGETVFTTVTTASGLGKPHVHQFTTAAAPAPGTFPKRIDYPTPGSVTIAMADMDGDGKLDIVTAEADRVHVLKNNGAGFNAATSFEIPFAPRSIAVGDVNNDGKLDIVTGSIVDALTGSVSVLINTTAGSTVSFGTRSDYPPKNRTLPKSVALGDVNGDGWLDIVTANDPHNMGGSGYVNVLINSGTGTFPTQTEYLTHYTPVSVAVGDMDGDGKLDIIAGNYYSDDVSVLINSATNPGTFGTATNFNIGEHIHAVAVGDLNSDGKLDIVTANTTIPGNPVSVLINNTTNNSLGFNALSDYPAGLNTQHVALGDLDGDSDLDIVATNINSNDVSVLKNLGSGTFSTTPTTYGVSNSPAEVAIADVDGDGDLDIVAANYSSNVNVLINKVIPPAIVSLSPNTAAVGASVIITGTHFTGATGVTFNGTAATSFTVNSATQITATVPTGATTGDVVVTNAGGGSTGVPFIVIPPPVTTSLSPTSGPVGTSVTITGTNFTGATGVTFNGIPATTYTVNSATQITTTAVAPGNVVVTTPGGSSTGVPFTITGPYISSISSGSGNIGTRASISGFNFSSNSRVTVNNINATIFGDISATSIVFIIPNGVVAGANPVIVTDNNLTSNSVTLTVPSPVITSVSPNRGPAGTSITITGTNFGVGSTVTIGGVSASISSSLFTQIKAIVPGSLSTGRHAVIITKNGLSSSPAEFTVSSLAISSLSPTNGVAGTSVTITGTNFTKATEVTFSGTPVTSFTVNSDTQITATVPEGATTGNVVVTVDNDASNGVAFIVAASPVISMLFPESGPVGTLLTIFGDYFDASPKVFMGGVEVTVVKSSSRDVIVTVPDGLNTGVKELYVSSNGIRSNVSAFTVTQPPTITSLSSSSGSVGSVVTITGTNFTGATGVTFNGTAATGFTVNSDTQITATVPEGATTGSVMVNTAAGSSDGVSFTVLVTPSLVAPSIEFTNSTKTYGDANFTLSATSNSSGAITYSVVSGTGATVTPAGEVTITSAGSVVLLASQAAEGNYAAGEKNSTLIINQASNTISFTNPGTKTYGDAAFELTASAISAGAVTFSVVSGPATINGSTLTLTGAGDVTLKASSGETTNYVAAVDQSVTFTVQKAPQSITLATIAGKTYGNADFTVSATTTSALPVTFTATGSATVSGTTVHITSAGTATITAHQAGDASYDAAPDVTQTFTISQKPLTPTFTASDKDYDGTATAIITDRSLTGGVAGTDDLSLGTSGTAAFADANAGINKTVTATGFALTGAAADNYRLTATSATTTATINKATATVSLSGLTGQSYTGSALSAGATTTPSGLAVNLTYDGTTQAPTAAGSYAVAGTINDNNYTGSASGTFVIGKAASRTEITIVGGPFTYTGSAQTPATVSVTGAGGLSLPPTATYANNTDAGTATASYSYAGDANHEGSSESKTFAIGKADAVINVTPYDVIYDGTAHTASITAVGVESTPVDLTSLIDAGHTTHTDAGDYTSDYWSFAGNGNYNAISNTIISDKIGKADQNITWSNPAAITYGTALDATQLNATVSGVSRGTATGSVAYTPAAGTILNAGNAQALTVTIAATTNYNAATKTVYIDVNKVIPVITWNNPAGIAESTPLSSMQLNASADVPGTFTYTPDAGTMLAPGVQTLSVDFIPADAANYNVVQNKTVSINVNGAPVLAPIGNKVVNEGTLLSFTASTMDANGDALTYTLVGTVPTGASINAATGAFNWAPSETQGPGSYSFKVRVTDNGTPVLYGEEQITITVNEVNSVPVLAAIGNKNVTAGGTLTFTAIGRDEDLPVQTLQYSAVPLPSGATLNTSTGAFSWTPTASQIGSYSITFKVTDGALSAQQTVTVTVSRPPAAATPNITSFTPTSGPIGTVVTLSGTNFSGTSKVTFNGTTATFTVVNNTTIRATVPVGAKTGKISVSATGGTSNSNQRFTVTASRTSITAMVKQSVSLSEVDRIGKLVVTAFSNPAPQYFTLLLQSSSTKPMSLKVIDNMGRIVEAKTGVSANSTLRIGHSYRPGVYFAQVIQEGKMITVKVIKQTP